MLGVTGWEEVGVIATIVIAAPVAVALVWAIIRTVGHVQRVHEVIIGRPATAYSDPIPSVIERFHLVDLHLTEQDVKIEAIEGQFETNGGGTVKDDLKKLQTTVDKMGKQAVDTAKAVSAELHQK